MADKGWIALHRSIRDHWLYQEKRVFSKYEAWLDILMDANHQDKKVLFDGKLIEVQRGCFITSIRQLCDRWGWSNSKVKRFLNILELDEMIKVKSDSKKTAITIDNYDFYQQSETRKATVEISDSHNREQSTISKSDTETTGKSIGNTMITDISENGKATLKRQQNVAETSQKHTNNNDNNVNNDNNIVVDDDKGLNFFQTYQEVFGVLNSLTAQKLNEWAKDMSPEIVNEALVRSGLNNAQTFGYTETILKVWSRSGVRTLEDVLALDLKREKANQSKKQNHSGGGKSPDQNKEPRLNTDVSF